MSTGDNNVYFWHEKLCRAFIERDIEQIKELLIDENIDSLEKDFCKKIISTVINNLQYETMKPRFLLFIVDNFQLTREEHQLIILNLTRFLFI